MSAYCPSKRWTLRRVFVGGRAEMLNHEPVMLREVLEVLALEPGDAAADGTLGLAGHALKMSEAIRPAGTLLGMDWDVDMLAQARERLSAVSDVAFHLVHGDFRLLPTTLEELKMSPSGVLLDLGLNSAQVDDPTRGISFMKEGPLDMRMDRSAGEPASALLNRLAPTEIERLLWDLGDERWAKAIAKKIVERRKDQPLRTTVDLVEAVMAAVPFGARDRRIHPATRTFQAVRIAVNGELEGLSEALVVIAKALAPGGTLAVLSYHSGEDRIVKTAFRALGEKLCIELFKKPQLPTAEEISRNPRSRSAKLRAVRRVR